MKLSDKLTDEQLAALIDCRFGREDMPFDDMDTFEAFGVAGHAAAMMEEERFEIQETLFSFSRMCSPSPAMCGFLGDESDDGSDDDDDEENDDESSRDSDNAGRRR